MACGFEIFYGMWGGEMPQRVKAHVWSPGSLYSIPPTHMVDGEDSPYTFSSENAKLFQKKPKEKNRYHILPIWQVLFIKSTKTPFFKLSFPKIF